MNSPVIVSVVIGFLGGIFAAVTVANHNLQLILQELRAMSGRKESEDDE